MNTQILALTAIALYLAGGFTTGLRLFRAKNSPPRGVGIGLAFAGVLLHSVVLYQGILTDDGINLSFFTVLSLSSWTIVLLLLVSSLTKPVENLSILILPLAAIAIVLEFRFPAIHLLAGNSPIGLKAHILISIIAYSLLSLAALQAILLAVQEAKLRHHQPGGFIRALPPLQTMESLLFEMITSGFILLSIALLTGFLFLENMFAQQLVHKTVLSLISWGVFATLLWGRYNFGWRGKVATRWTLSGVVVLLLAYFGSKAVLELIL